MARIYNKRSLSILKQVSQNPNIPAISLFQHFSANTFYKDFYNNVYRLKQLELLNQEEIAGKMCLSLTLEGKKVLGRFNPEKDGVWKLVIFDIPEKQKYVRTVLRAKLKSLHFKKWQNSIWISPFAMDEEIEEEINTLGKKFFVRLIKTTNINLTADLEKMFS